MSFFTKKINFYLKQKNILSVKRYKNIIIIKHNKRNTDSQGAIFVHCVVVIIYKVLSQNNLWPALQMNPTVALYSRGCPYRIINVIYLITCVGLQNFLC